MKGYAYCSDVEITFTESELELLAQGRTVRGRIKTRLDPDDRGHMRWCSVRTGAVDEPDYTLLPTGACLDDAKAYNIVVPSEAARYLHEYKKYGARWRMAGTKLELFVR